MADSTPSSPISGPVFVLGGASLSRIYSQDGRTFRNAATGADGLEVGIIFFFEGNCFFTTLPGFRSKGLEVTSDAVNYEFVKTEATQRAVGVFPFKDLLYMVGGIGDRGRGSVVELRTSEDGRTWSKPQPFGTIENGKPGKTGPMLRRAASDGERVVVVGDFGRRVSSTNGVDWVEADETEPGLTTADVAYGNGVWVTSGLHGARSWSSDGLHWSPMIPGEEGEHINALAFTGERFVGVGQGATYLSENGENWERIPTEEAPPITVFGGGLFLGFHWPGRIFISPDGIAWEQVAELEYEVLSLGYGVLGSGAV